MLDLSNRLLALAIVVFVFSGLGNQVSALSCRDGIENSVGYVYWSQKCSAGETACFQSVKCTKIGDTPYTDYQWNCIDGKLCSNSTGKSVATYNGVKGISMQFNTIENHRSMLLNFQIIKYNLVAFIF